MIKVIFVCLGNICRSPMAEGLFREKVSKRNLEHMINVGSSATSRYEIGSAPHAGTRKILSQLGISTSGMKASQITKEEFDESDYIIGMDFQNMKYLNEHKTKDNVHLLLDINSKVSKKEVPDPWFTNDFNETYTLLNESLDMWLDKIIEENKL